jgi:hypothetical protein
MDELAVELCNRLRVIKHNLGHERAGLHIAASLELEQISLCADHGIGLEPLQ